MNIAIITVYQPFTNLGSFLQAYALKTFLEQNGHNVRFIKTGPHKSSALRLVSKARPYRSFFLRFKKAFYALRDLKRLSFTKIGDKSTDCYIWGSDEIWNVSNPFFCRQLFFGAGISDRPKIGYAISAGHATKTDFIKNSDTIEGITHFDRIFSRDTHTKLLLNDCYSIDTEIVVDPTLLITANKLSEKIRLPKQKYLLVYTYGIDNEMVAKVKKFAAKHKLQIISPCFWHIWADSTVECSALQFSTLIANAEYVFTTTFHGAIFSIINHSKCCILPLRQKVRNLCETLNCEERIIAPDCTFDEFEQTITKPFRIKEFEDKLQKLRNDSSSMLLHELNQLTK